MTAPSPTERDLELLVPVDITVKFGRPEAKSYTIPGDMPLEPYLHVQTAMLDETDEVAGTRHLQTALEKLLLWYVPVEDAATRTEVKEQIARLGVRSVMRILNAIYETDDEPADDVEGEARDVTPPPIAPVTVPTPTTTGPSLSEGSPTLPSQPELTTGPGSD